MVNSILFSLILTLIIELTISIVIGIRGKDLIKIMIINIITNVLLNIFVIHLYNHFDNKIVYYFVVPVLEIVVFSIEGKLFKKLDNNVIGPYKLSLLLNGSSYGFGLICYLISYIIK